MGDVTELLHRARADDRKAIDQIIAIVYPDLHRMARARLAGNDTITLLDATSMVHEVYLRLQQAARIEAESRGQFMAYASQAMRASAAPSAAEAAPRTSPWRPRSSTDR